MRTTLNARQTPAQFRAAPRARAVELHSPPAAGANHEFARMAVSRDGAGGPGPTRTFPEAVRRKMESALDADFSSVRIHEGDAAPRMGALAYTQGQTIHFAPGLFQPHSRTGQELLGHELTHVVQQREGRVRSTLHVGGTAVNDETRLEAEAHQAGARAALHHAPAGGPAAGAGASAGHAAGPAGGEVAQGVFGWLWKLLGYPDAPANNPVARTTLTLPAAPVRGKPKKPGSLQATDSLGNNLAYHHKFPSNRIVNEANAVINGTAPVDAHTNLEEWGQRQAGGGTIGVPGLTWTPHNVFPGPLPDHRAPGDDPGGNDLDTHFTRSGSVTPRSGLALDLANQGGISQFDPGDLQARLAQLPDRDESGYDSDEWTGPRNARRQRGRPADWFTHSIAERAHYARHKRYS